MTDPFIPPPDEPPMEPGTGAKNIPELDKLEDHTIYVDPLEAE